MSDEPKDCSALVYDSQYGPGRSCSKRGTIEREGKWFCGTHDPVLRKERDAKRREEQEAFWAQRRADRDREARIERAERALVSEVLATDIRHLPESLIAARQALLDAKVEPAAVAGARQENR